jgi:hypothetical protein
MGADVNNRARDGVPNLVHACLKSKEQEDFCIDLIRAGADVRLTDEVKAIKFLFFRYSIKRVSYFYRQQNVQLCIMLVYLEVQMLYENFYVLKLIQMR